MRLPAHTLRNCSLPVRLILFVFIPTLLFATGFGYVIFGQLEQWGKKRMQEDVELIARTLEAPVSRALERKRQGTLEHSLDSVLKIGRVYGAFLYDDQGGMVATSSPESSPTVIESDIYEMVEREEQVGGYGKMAGEPVYSYFVPLKSADGDFLGLLQVSRLHREMLDQIGRLREMAMSFLVLLAGGMLGIIFIGYQGAIGRSLVHLRDTMGKVKTGERRHRATCQGPSEIVALAESFNRMLDSIEEAEVEIGRRRASEAELEKKLQKTENLAALGQVAAGVAHELGTPLSVVDGKAQRALRGQDLPEDCRASLQAVRGEVRRMEQIVRQLLEFGRSHDGQTREMRLDQLLQTAAGSLSDLEEQQGVDIECAGDASSPMIIKANLVRMELALGNLLKNALQTRGVNRVLARWGQSGKWAEIVVEDDGPGVPLELRSKIFQPFFTTRADQKGSGLGLAIVQQVVDENDGLMAVETSSFGGAAFRLRLPLAT